MATVTIHYKAIRDVLVRAAWMTAVSALGNNENHMLWLDDSEDEFNGEREEIAGRVELYTGAVTLMSEIEATPTGETVKIDAETANNVRQLYEALQENPEPLMQAPQGPERNTILWRYDAAETVLAEIAGEEAVI